MSHGGSEGDSPTVTVDAVVRIERVLAHERYGAPWPAHCTRRCLLGGRATGRLRLVCLPAALVGCLEAPPPPEADADAATATSMCGNARVDVAYMSRFLVDPDSYGRASIDRVAVIINSGLGLLDLAALEVIDASIEETDGELSFFASSGSGQTPVQPGEARGELSSWGRDMVLARLSEDWTDPDAPELGGMITTTRSRGELHGSVVLALGPHRVTLDLEFELTTFQGSGAYPQDASRSTSICVEGS
jgi:hypothetical protein